MQIEPQYTIPLVYLITDPNDATVYFIRATVYDSLTRDIISTQSLVSRGNGLWSSTVLAPGDGSGFGRHIHVIIKVYTDSGYSILSDIYNQQIDKYLVKSSNKFGGGGSGGGADIDYDKIRRIMKTLFEDYKDAPISFDKIEKKLNEISGKVSDIEIPEQKEITPTDLQPIIVEIRAVGKEIGSKVDGIELPQPIDHSGSFKELGDKISAIPEEVSKIVQAISDTKELIKKTADGIKELFTGFTKKMDEKSETMKKVVGAFIGDGGADIPAPKPADPEKEKAMSKFFPKQ